jgi:membrane protease YdiL (CAAX protease family)
VRLIDIFPALAGMAFVAAPFLWCRRQGEDPESYGLSWKFRRRDVVECAVITTLTLIALTCVAMNWPGEKLPRHSSFSRAANMALNGVSAAIIEEIFFRGWIQSLFRKKFGAAASIASTSAIFASAHVFVASPPFIAAVFFPGCLMGFLRERHGNIFTSTLFHATANLWAIWFVPRYFPTLREWITIIGFN